MDQALGWCQSKGLLTIEVIHALDKPRPHTVLGYSWETLELAFEPPHLEALEAWYAGLSPQQRHTLVTRSGEKLFTPELVGA